MLPSPPRLSFRTKVVLLAVALVTAIQLLTLLPTLRAVKDGLENEANLRVERAGVQFDAYMQDRAELLPTACIRTCARKTGESRFRRHMRRGSSIRR